MGSTDARKIATAVVRGYLKEAVLRHRDRESLRTPCSEDGCSTMTWEVEWQSDTMDEDTSAYQSDLQVEGERSQVPSPPPPRGRAPSNKRPGRRRRKRHDASGCRDTLQAPPETASEVLCLPAPPRQSPWSALPHPAQPFPRVTTAGLSYAVVPIPPTPKWLTREANKARVDILRSQKMDSPQSMDMRDLEDRPSVNLRMYKSPMEPPWRQQRAKPQRGQKQTVSSNSGSVKTHGGSSSSTAAATGFSSVISDRGHSSVISDRGLATMSENTFSGSEMMPNLSRSQMLPKLVDEEKMEAWREAMVASAMSMARTCDVPRGLLLRTGALSFQ